MNALSRLASCWVAALAVPFQPLVAQREPAITVQQLVHFLTASDREPRSESAEAKARILASEIGARANGPLTELLSQPYQAGTESLLSRALMAAWYNPIDVPESLLLSYVEMRPSRVGGMSPPAAGDVRLRALIALSYRPRPGLLRFWEDLWASERDPVILQVVLGALACTEPDRARPLVNRRYASRLLNEVSGRIREELDVSGGGLLCHGGESTREAAWSFTPTLDPALRDAGRRMLLRSGVHR